MKRLQKNLFLRVLATLVLLPGLAACSGESRPVFFSGPIMEAIGPDGQLALAGAVANGQDQDADYVQVTFIFYGAGGEVIETTTQLVEGSDDLGTLPPGEEGGFFVVTETPAEQIEQIQYVLSFDEISLEPEQLR